MEIPYLKVSRSDHTEVAKPTDIARSSSKEEASFRSQVLVSNKGAFNGESRAEMLNLSFEA